MMGSPQQSGYIALISVLIIGAVALTVATALLITGADAQQENLARQQSLKARHAAAGCIEEGLQQLHDNTAFTGTNNLTLGGTPCSYTVTNTGGTSARNYLLVVGDSAVLTTQDTFIRDRLLSQSHTVTVIDDSAAVPADINTTYHAVIMSSTANTNQITTKYNATTRGVLSFGPYPHSNFTTQVSPSNGTSTTTQYVSAANGDAITPTGSGTNVTYLGAAAVHTYIDDSGTSLGSGVTKFLAARNDLLTRVTGARYETGSLMTSGITAPSRRVRIGFTELQLLNATGLTWFDNAVAWVTPPPDTQAVTVTATSTSGTVVRKIQTYVTINVSSLSISSWQEMP